MHALRNALAEDRNLQENARDWLKQHENIKLEQLEPETVCTKRKQSSLTEVHACMLYITGTGWLTSAYGAQSSSWLGGGQPLTVGLVEESSEERQQLQRLAEYVVDDERARLGARAIECGSMEVAAAGADAIFAMSGSTKLGGVCE